MTAVQPDVSVVIPVYNAALFVEEAVRSALAQPETGEVLLIEDGSPDDSLRVCEQLASQHERVRLLQHPHGENRGAGPSRNLGIQNARGEFIAFLDADDYYLPNRFRIALASFAEQPEADGVYEAVGTAYEDEFVKQWWLTGRKPELTTITQRLPAERFFAEFITGRVGYFCTDGITVRRAIFDRTGLFGELRMCQDHMMWVKMAAVGSLVPGDIDNPVAMRRLHGENRIYRNRDEHRAYEIEMWLQLLIWGRAHSLAPEKMRLLCARAISSFHSAKHSGQSPFRSDVQFLARLLRRCPGAVTEPSFQRELKRVVGLTRLRRAPRKARDLAARALRLASRS